jgi:glycosyltransferase involved in cell wall biosynthesis
MKLSYLITCSTETNTLGNLIKRIGYYVHGTIDEIVILFDTNANEETKLGVNIYKNENPINIHLETHSLNNDYGAHKNFGNEQCSGDWIFQCDGDELPSIGLLENLKTVIQSNPDVELVFVPRINDFRGVTPEHAKQWGWRLTPSPSYENRLVVNWPDYQGRIYKRDTTRIKWDRKLHEKIVGHKQYSFLPAEEEWALYHDKTIETQIKTNLRYNQVFTEADNKGHTVT